jgi:hypothetical protein
LKKNRILSFNWIAETTEDSCEHSNRRQNNVDDRKKHGILKKELNFVVETPSVKVNILVNILAKITDKTIQARCVIQRDVLNPIEVNTQDHRHDQIESLSHWLNIWILDINDIESPKLFCTRDL